MLPSLDGSQVLLSGDIMETAGKIHLVVVMVSPKKNAQIDNIFGVQLGDKSAESVSAAVIMVGEHVQNRHGCQIGGVEFDEDSAIKYSKDLIESALNTKVQQVSTKACFAESAIKLIKQRVRIKLSACVYDMNDIFAYLITTFSWSSLFYNIFAIFAIIIFVKLLIANYPTNKNHRTHGKHTSLSV